MLKHCNEQLRVLLYSHDTVGLGHLRRNQAIASSLAKSLRNPSIMIISGTRQGAMFDLPSCVEMVTIPAIKKAINGAYVARNTSLPTDEALSMRSEIIRSITECFRPDVLIVDKVPRGIHGELDASLDLLRSNRQTLCVLGLRDILDEPEIVRSEWQREQNEVAIQQQYDAVWVYGDQCVYDLAAECELAASTREKIRYTGYLNRKEVDRQWANVGNEEISELEAETRKLQVCMVGGGEDGGPLASAFSQVKFAEDSCGVIVCGPNMPMETRAFLSRQAQRNPALRLIEFLKHPERLLARADRVVAMGGYNTVCELLSQRKPMLIVPRVFPRQEQLIRAQRLMERGLLHWLHPAALTADSLSDWLRRPIADTPHGKIDMEGLSQIPTMLLDLIDEHRMRRAAVGGTPHLVRRPVPALKHEVGA